MISTPKRLLEGRHNGSGFQGFSLNTDMIRTILHLAKPLGHHENPKNDNLGFGFLYYSVVRAVRPAHVLVVGSGFGFSVICLALGLKDNGRGILSFVDPSYNVLRHGPLKTVGGRGNWDDPKKVACHFGQFGVGDIVTHYKLTSHEFFSRFQGFDLPRIDVAFIDGNHAYRHVRHDFIQVLQRAGKNAYIFLHDTNIYFRELIGNAGVKRWLDTVKTTRECFEVIDFPFASGVALVRVLKEDAWRYLEQ